MQGRIDPLQMIAGRTLGQKVEDCHGRRAAGFGEARFYNYGSKRHALSIPGRGRS
ncbi:hypothetical protein GCM10010533_25590 [Mycolicibacterium pallens]